MSAILCLVHSEYNDCGRVGVELRKAGHSIERIDFTAGNRPSHGLGTNHYSGCIVFGGTQNVYELHSTTPQELELIEEALRLRIPMIGICLGAQLISTVLGAKIEAHPEGLLEIGFNEVSPTSTCHPLFQATMLFYQWHRDDLKLPHGGIHIAKSDIFPTQAYAYDNALALQFHPDATPDTIARWCTIGADTLSHCHAPSQEEQVRMAYVLNETMNSWVRELIEHTLTDAWPYA